MVTFLSSFVMAGEFTASKIVVKSVPDVTVYLKIIEASASDDPELYSMILERTDEYGDAYFMYSTDDPNKMQFDLEVKVKDGKVQVYPAAGTSLYGGYSTGEDVYIDAYEDYHNIVETPGREVALEIVNDSEEVLVEEVVADETLVEEVAVDDVEGESNDLVTGRSISDVAKGPAVYGGAIGIFVLAVFGLLLFGRKRKISAGGKSKSRSPSDKDESDNDLSRANSKLKSVQAEIQRLKSQDKVSDVRKRIAAEEEELRKLRSERI